MKTFLVRPAVLAALTTLPPASTLIAQGPQTAFLNEAEVRQLIVRGEPADHSVVAAESRTGRLVECRSGAENCVVGSSS
jgi:hypothetical protein